MELQLSQLVDTSAPEATLKEVLHLGALVNPDFNNEEFTKTFNDIQNLFQGTYPGYRACNTTYHDFAHTYEVTLAMSRLMHGAFLAGVPFSGKDVQIGLTAALMHDTGYIQEVSDFTGTGAKYTLTHIDRSINFFKEYGRNNPFFGNGVSKDFANILYCTGLSVKIGEIGFSSAEISTLGKMMGTADLLGQMAARLYLEKLPFLYREFLEGGLSQFTSELDLLQKTIGFHELTRRRFSMEFSGVDEYLVHHFRQRWGIDRNLYQESIQRNIDYLRDILAHNRENFTRRLKRNCAIPPALPNRTS